MIQQLRSHKTETLEERRLRLKDYAMKKQTAYSMTTNSQNNKNVASYLQKHYTYNNLSEMGNKKVQSHKTTPLVIVRNNRRTIPKV